MSAHELTSASIDRAFEIAVKRLANDLRYGSDLSRYSGAGVDYLQSRPLVDGDSVKDIDWRVTARTGRYHVKENESLKTTPIYLVVDTSASMAISSTRMSKHALAALVAGGLALAGLRRLSPVGLVAAGDRELHFRPSLSRGRVFQWLHDLRHRRFDERTLLTERIDQIGALLKSTSLVVVISDLHDEGAVPAIKRLAGRHDCIVIQIEDPAERGHLRGGMFRGVEAESGRTFVAHGRTRWFLDPEQRPHHALKSAAVDYLLLATDRPFVAPLSRLLQERGAVMRNTR